MNEPTELWNAEFDPRIKPYYLWSTTIILCVTIIGIPFAILYLIVGNWLISKHIANLGCTLNDRTLEIKKGILNKTESTIPLEKITDLQMFQGPIMRHFGLRGFKVETAGQSSAPGGALVNMIGIVNAVEFRKSVLDQRDQIAQGRGPATPNTGQKTGPTHPESEVLLGEIRDTLLRIESKFEQS